MSDLLGWLRKVCAEYTVEPVAVFQRQGNHVWPFIANNELELEQRLQQGGHFLPLPKEPAALANVIEVSLVDFILKRLNDLHDTHARRGTERGYPDIEISGPQFGNGYHALDVKVARRHRNRKQTQSRITLYTGNTYFRYPTLQWPGTFRPFRDYASHLDLIAVYTLNENSFSRVDDFKLIVQDAWRIGSKQRSSTTREYLGAVMSIADLEAGRGDFKTADEFYAYWRKYPFKIGRAVQQQLDKLLAKAELSNKD